MNPRTQRRPGVGDNQVSLAAVGVHALACFRPPNTLKRELQLAPARGFTMTPRKYIRVCASVLLTGLAMALNGPANAQSLPPGARLRLGALDFRHPDTINTVLLPA